MKTYYKVEDILDKLNEVVKITDMNYIDDDDKTLISSDKLLDMIDDLMYEYHRLQDEKDDLEEELENTDDKIDEFYIRKDIRQL